MGGFRSGSFTRGLSPFGSGVLPPFQELGANSAPPGVVPGPNRPPSPKSPPPKPTHAPPRGTPAHRKAPTPKAPKRPKAPRPPKAGSNVQATGYAKGIGASAAGLAKTLPKPPRPVATPLKLAKGIGPKGVL